MNAQSFFKEKPFMVDFILRVIKVRDRFESLSFIIFLILPFFTFFSYNFYDGFDGVLGFLFTVVGYSLLETILFVILSSTLVINYNKYLKKECFLKESFKDSVYMVNDILLIEDEIKVHCEKLDFKLYLNIMKSYLTVQKHSNSDGIEIDILLESIFLKKYFESFIDNVDGLLTVNDLVFILDNYSLKSKNTLFQRFHDVIDFLDYQDFLSNGFKLFDKINSLNLSSSRFESIISSMATYKERKESTIKFRKKLINSSGIDEFLNLKDSEKSNNNVKVII